MSRLPMVTAKEMVQYHLGEDLGRRITNKILHDVEVSRENFLKWYHKKK